MNLYLKLTSATFLGLLSFNAYANEECVKPFGHTEDFNVRCLSEGLAAFHNDDNKVGFMNSMGHIVIPPIYDAEMSQMPILPEFKEGLAAVHIYPEHSSDGKWGFIDKTGKIVVPLQYKYAGSFNEGLASVVNFNDKVGFINRNGQVIIPFKYAYNEVAMYGNITTPQFSEGLAAVKATDNGKYGYINKGGILVIPYQYDNVNDFSEGLAAVSKNNQEFFIDETGKTVIRLKTGENVVGYRGKVGFIDGLADITKSDGTSYQINKQGDRVK